MKKHNELVKRMDKELVLVRLPADRYRADVQRGERKWWDGPVVRWFDGKEVEYMEPEDRHEELLDKADWVRDEL